MILTGRQHKQLHEALLLAFPKEVDLDSMVRFGLGENRAAIAGGDNVSDRVFRLIEWAAAHDRMADLVEAAFVESLGNSALQPIANEMDVHLPVKPVSQARGPRAKAFRDYLAALCAYCNELPYVTLPGKPLPSLISIYTEPRGKGLYKPRFNREQFMNALDQRRHLLIEGDPGLGKSTLLHYLAYTLAMSWLNDVPSSLLPVRVGARHLSERAMSMSESIYACVATELGQRLPYSLPPDFFAEPLIPGTAWLVLVDGLDEVVVPTQRENLISAITYHAAKIDGPYRFVITTRPLKESSFLNRAHFESYSLRPFEPKEIRIFAHHWFSARYTEQPDEAESFLRQLETKRIADLARVPLLATMAAAVYERDNAHALPTRRAGLYERFVTVLLDDEESRRDTREPFVREWRRRYGEEGARQADTLFSNRRALLEHLALWQQEGGLGSLLDEAIRFTRESKWLPGAGNFEWLREQMRILLQRTGILVQQAGAESFLHETFREYLAASAICHRCIPEDQIAATFIDRWQVHNWWEVILFMLGIWSEWGYDVGALVQRNWEPIIQRQADRHEADLRLRFVTTSIKEDALIDEATKHRFVTELLSLARVPSMVGLVRKYADVFFELGPIKDWLELVSDSAVDESLRTEVAGKILDLGGIDSWLILGCDKEVMPRIRVQAADALLMHGQATAGSEILLAFIRDPVIDDQGRKNAVTVLLRHGRTSDWMSSLRDTTIPGWIRIKAAKALLVKHQTNQVMPILLAMTRDRAVDEQARRDAAEVMLEHASARDLLTLARDSVVDEQTRTRAVNRLVQRGQVEDLWAIARDLELDHSKRLQIIEALLEQGQAKDWLVLTQDPTVEGWARVRAAKALLESAQHNGALLVMLELACDSRLDQRLRRSAAELLLQYGKADDWLTLVHNSEMDEQIQARAIERLVHQGQAEEWWALVRDQTLVGPARVRLLNTLLERGSAEDWSALLRDSVMEEWVQVEAANLLLKAGHSEVAIPSLLEFAHDSKLNAQLRKNAVEALFEHGGVNEWLALTRDASVDEWVHARAADMLMEQGNTDIWLVLAQDVELAPVVRLAALKALVHSGEHERATEILLSLAQDLSASAGMRLLAAKLLASLGLTKAVVPSLLMLVSDPMMAPLDQVELAIALGDLGQLDAGLALLLNITQDRALDGWARSYAQRALVRLQRALNKR